MPRSPGLAASEVHGPLEVVLVLGSGEPTRLAGGLAGRSAPASGAVALMPAVARIRTKKLQAALVFAAIPTSHRVPSSEDASLAKQTASAAPTSSLRRTHRPAVAGPRRHAPGSAGIGRFKPVLLREIQTGADRRGRSTAASQ